MRSKSKYLSYFVSYKQTFLDIVTVKFYSFANVPEKLRFLLVLLFKNAVPFRWFGCKSSNEWEV